MVVIAGLGVAVAVGRRGLLCGVHRGGEAVEEGGRGLVVVGGAGAPRWSAV